jgi:chromosome segregation ATPase
MTTKAQIKDTIGDIEAELSTLQDRHEQATSGVEQARARLDEIGRRRGEIASSAYFGDAPAVEELKTIDTETDELVRVVALAQDAAAALGADIADAKERLASERHRSSSEQVAQLRAERQAIREQALKAADELLAVLAEDKSLHEKMISAVQNGGNAATLENLARNHDEAALHRELGTKLRAYAPAWT